VIIRDYLSRADAHLILIDNDQVVINTLNQAEYNLVEKRDGTWQVDILKASHTDQVRRYRKICSKIKDTIDDIASKLDDIEYENFGYQLIEGDVPGNIVFSALIYFKKPQGGQKPSKNTTGLEEQIQKHLL
jgi:hypothetical protein